MNTDAISIVLTVSVDWPVTGMQNCCPPLVDLFRIWDGVLCGINGGFHKNDNTSRKCVNGTHRNDFSEEK